MPLNKIQIFSTRLLDGNVAKATDQNIEVDTIPFINVQPLVSDELKTDRNNWLTQQIVVVFTSSNAVEAVANEVGSATTLENFLYRWQNKGMRHSVFW